MNDYDPILFTQRQVFGRDTASGTLSTNDDYNEHIRPFGSPQPPAVEYDMLDYLTNGAGRYATPAVFPIIDDFFNTPILANTEKDPFYDVSDIRRELNLTDDDDFIKAIEVDIWQYGTDTTSLDFPERAYIFGTTGFELDLANANFRVNDNGNRFISGMQVIAKEDNFDFRGGARIINDLANLVLLPAYDPYELGTDPTTKGQNREVPIKFTPSTSGRTYGTPSDLYSGSDYLAHDLYELNRVSIKDTASGAAKLALGISQFLNPINSTLAGSYLLDINSDPFLRYLRDDLKVIYGTPGNDNITHLDRENDLFDPLPIYPPVLIVGGSGDDNITGSLKSDELLGGEDNDVLNGRAGNDTLNGGADNDVLDGGDEEDYAIFTGEFADYEFNVSTDKKTITVEHARGAQADGTDTLRNMEFALFQDVSVPFDSGNLNIFPESNGTDDSGNQNIFPESEPETVTRVIPLPL